MQKKIIRFLRDEGEPRRNDETRWKVGAKKCSSLNLKHSQEANCTKLFQQNFTNFDFTNSH